jgi:TonB family protein
VPLDKFKTQVLLLHREQSALDDLTSGFDEQYTVHCATSGSEALNTLVETPINVIVSAQDLPGMSGLEALREAKKRSPDTVGILLAEGADDGLEALVGDKEVFQIVRGSVTGDSILELVDTATQQVRLMALAESANDNAANVDETAAEHIVMETSENGATIISDGTGRLPTLDPGKIDPASSIGARSIDLLVLTKDQEFLSTIKDSSRGRHTVHYAYTLAQADEIIREHKVGVAVVDAAMVGHKIEQLTQYLRRESPRLVAVVAGRRDDGEMLMDLINRGKLYRFLLKPVSPGRARLAVEASVKYHLEAPDAAFKTKDGATASQAAPVSQAQATAKSDARAQEQPEPTPKAGVEAPQPSASQSTAVADPTGKLPAEDGQESASDVDGSSFTETVTGFLGTFYKKSSNDEDAETPDDEAGPSDLAPTPAAGSGGSLLQSKQMLGIGAAAIIVLSVVLFWFISKPEETVTDEEPKTGTATVVDTVTEERVTIEPPATSAAVEADAAVTEGLADSDTVVEDALTAAESAMLESRLDDAGDALERAGSLDPDNARLPFLSAQLSQLQLRAQLADARTAIREKRFDDAGSTLEAARSLNVADITEIDAVEDELNTARSEQRAEDVLVMANARLEDGDLLSPANDNARYYYELALSNDPENTAARQGLNVVASKLAIQARSDIDSGNLDSAEELLDEAIALDASNSEIAAAVGALSKTRDEIAAERRRQAEAKSRAEIEQQQRAARAEAERKAAEERAAQVAAEQEARAAAELSAEQPAATEDSNTATGDAQATVEDASTADVDAAPSKMSAIASPAAVSSLKRSKYVAPKYPRAAQRRNLSGWVDVVFTVTTDGSVKDIEIRNSEPGETFVNAATKAVAKWEFEPVVENGTIVEKLVGVRMMFALE